MYILLYKECIPQNCLYTHALYMSNGTHCSMPYNSNKTWRNLNVPQLDKSHEVWDIRTMKYYLAFKKNEDLKVKIHNTLAREKDRL